MNIIMRIEDSLLAYLQRCCDHPGQMVAADVLEGCSDQVAIKHCRRCGAIKPVWSGQHADWAWRTPDPNLWRG